MRWVYRSVAVVAVFMGWGSIAPGAEIGEPAPPLSIGEWVKGEPVDLAKGLGKKIYVIDFWATWCIPCRQNMPLLTKLQNLYKDNGVVFVGVAMADAPDSPKFIREFIQERGDDLGYPIGIDDGGATVRAYMDPFCVSSIPHAFVVDRNGKLAWHGHPIGEDLDRVLRQVLIEDFDVEAFKTKDEERRQLLCGGFWVSRYVDQVIGGAKARDIRDMGEKALKIGLNSYELMNRFAWTLLDDRRIKDRDLELAMKAAQAAYDGCAGQDAAVVDTYARALFELGRIDEAIRYQRQAVEMVDDGDYVKEEFLKALERYEKKKKEQPPEKPDGAP